MVCQSACRLTCHGSACVRAVLHCSHASVYRRWSSCCDVCGGSAGPHLDGRGYGADCGACHDDCACRRHGCASGYLVREISHANVWSLAYPLYSISMCRLACISSRTLRRSLTCLYNLGPHIGLAHHGVYLAATMSQSATLKNLASVTSGPSVYLRYRCW